MIPLFLASSFGSTGKIRLIDSSGPSSVVGDDDVAVLKGTCEAAVGERPLDEGSEKLPSRLRTGYLSTPAWTSEACTRMTSRLVQQRSFRMLGGCIMTSDWELAQSGQCRPLNTDISMRLID